MHLPASRRRWRLQVAGGKARYGNPARAALKLSDDLALNASVRGQATMLRACPQTPVESEGLLHSWRRLRWRYAIEGKRLGIPEIERTHQTNGLQ